MIKRVVSGLVLGAIAIGAIWAGGIYFAVAIALFTVVALFELFRALKKKGHTPIVGAGIIMLLVSVAPIVTEYTAPAIIRFRDIGNVNIFAPVMVAAIIYVLTAMVVRHNKYNIVDGALTLFGGAYIVYFFSFFVTLRNLEAGAYMTLLAIIGCIGADTAAFFIGCKFGKKKLIPEVSPNKTVAGSIAAFGGGIAACLAFGLLLMALDRFPQMAIYHYVIIGAIIGAVAQIGDLCASAMKRYCGIKDFGKIIPGHGGILDRFDAYLLAVPVVYYYYVFFMKFILYR